MILRGASGVAAYAATPEAPGTQAFHVTMGRRRRHCRGYCQSRRTLRFIAKRSTLRSARYRFDRVNKSTDIQAIRFAHKRRFACTIIQMLSQPGNAPGHALRPYLPQLSVLRLTLVPILFELARRFLSLGRHQWYPTIQPRSRE